MKHVNTTRSYTQQQQKNTQIWNTLAVAGRQEIRLTFRCSRNLSKNKQINKLNLNVWNVSIEIVFLGTKSKNDDYWLTLETSSMGTQRQDDLLGDSVSVADHKDHINNNNGYMCDLL